MLTATQRTCLRIVEVFENAVPDRYDLLVSVKGDTGGLSGGLLMASMASGNLGKMLRLYRNMGGITITEERAGKVLFSEPYYRGGIAALVTK